MLSFVKDYCIFDKQSSVGSTELFNTYKVYCEECGMKPFSQKAFVQQILLVSSDVSRGVDTLGKKRVIHGLKLGEVLG